jgi:hypothetical protein
MSKHSVVYIGNTHFAQIEGLSDQDGVPVTTATVELLSVTDNETGAPVSGIQAPLTMPHVGNALYRASISHTAGFVPGRVYQAVFTAIGPTGQLAQWTETLIARKRAA